MTTIVRSTSGSQGLLEAEVGGARTESGVLELNAASPTFAPANGTLVETRPRTASQPKPRVSIRVRKKVRGILIRFCENEATVVFDDGREGVEYRLPRDLLRKNGVTSENQPFELIEREMTENKQFRLYSEVVPLAPASSGTIEPLPLTKVYKAKMNFLLKSSPKRVR